MSHPGTSEHGHVDVIEPECFSEEALQSVYQLNRTVVELLVTSARRTASEAQSQIVLTLSPALLALGSSAREELARCPIALADFGFRNLELWRQIESGHTVLPSLSACFPHPQATQLAQSTLTLAWTLWQSNRDASAIVFGLAPECAAILAKIGVQSIPRIAEFYPHCVRPRWETDIHFWRQLMRVAQLTDSPAQPRLPSIGVYAMQRQLADLIHLPPYPATPETASTRTNQR